MFSTNRDQSIIKALESYKAGTSTVFRDQRRRKRGRDEYEWNVCDHRLHCVIRSPSTSKDNLLAIQERSANFSERIRRHLPASNDVAANSSLRPPYNGDIRDLGKQVSDETLPIGDDTGGLERPEENPEMLLQPETRPISHDQLVIEVKGIYAGLVMVESKCIDIYEKQSAAAQEKDPAKKTTLKNEQLQSLIALHKQLLHEHHDFFLASQHPAASPALSRLAAKYSMPARMWKHGIHAFLEVLRYRLPESLEHMLAFICIAYNMMALLYETVPVFEATWIECLGNLFVIYPISSSIH